jgi:xylulokinase
VTVFGLDVGTSGVKGLALSPEGDILARAEAGYPLCTPRPGWAEQDPEDWWRATSAVLAQLRAAVGEPAGIGLSGQMHGLVALDSSDDVIRPAILWNDQRTAAECAEIEERVGLPELIAETGNRALTGFTAPKLLWMRRHEPAEYSRIASILLPKDYIRLRLTGERVTEVTDASGTLLLDVAGRRWSTLMCEALEIPREWLPPVLESVQAAGAGDQAAGALGVGVDRPGPVSVAMGTSGVVFAALPAYAADPQARVHTFCHSVPGTWHQMGVMLSAAGSLAWLRDAIAPEVDFARLVAEAERWEPGAEGLTFLPYLAGERTPHADSEARGAFTGLTLRHDRGAFVRAVLEGVAFGLRDSLDLVGGAEVGRVSGGGARSDLWMRIVASVLEIPLERMAADEGAAYGAALLGGVAGGVWSDAPEAVAATVRTTAVVEPDPEWTGRYREARETYRALYPALKGIAA